MPDYTVKTLGEIEATHGGGFRKARAALGVTSFGMQILELPPDFDGHPEHDHLGSGQEEVYVVMRGRGEIEIDGERIAIDPETLVRIGPSARRKIYAGPDGLKVLALGAVPGQAYQAPHFTKLGTTDLVHELPDEELQDLLRDPQCPVEVQPDGTRVIALSEFHRLAETRFGQIDGMEERLDQFLTHMGGSVVRRPAGVAFAFPETTLRGLGVRPGPYGRATQ
jgi:hypothetical protein